MWLVIAEENTRCRECFHTIKPGSECLSQLPLDMPVGIRRGKYENFCIDCPNCETDKAPCYVRWFGHWYTGAYEATKEPVPCGQCNALIANGAHAFAQKFFAWPASEDEPEQTTSATAHRWSGPGVVAADAARRLDGPFHWNSLSHDLQRKFYTAGLGGDRGSRTASEAARFYEESIPSNIRLHLRIPDSIKEFLQGRQASHIESVANAPHRTKDPGNIIVEPSAQPWLSFPCP